MINRVEANKYIGEALPELGDKTELIPENNVNVSVQALLDYTKAKTEGYEFDLVRKCFDVAEKLYLQGDGPVKAAIENVYVYSLDSLLCRACKYKAELMNLIPASLHGAYIRQVLQSNV